MTAQQLKITFNSTTVSALLLRPNNARACLVLAHGAGAGMSHPFMETVATGLGERGIATFRYQFPYMEEGSKRPDAPAVAHAAVRAAVAEAARRESPSRAPAPIPISRCRSASPRSPSAAAAKAATGTRATNGTDR